MGKIIDKKENKIYKAESELKQLTEEELKKICNNLKEIFKGGVVVENPEKYQSAMKKYYENNKEEKKWK